MRRGTRHALVGRERELQLLGEKLDETQNDKSCQLVLLEGEAGIGKSRLLAEAATLARARDFRVLSGAAEELEMDRPFGAVADALEVSIAATNPERSAIGRLMIGLADDGSIAPSSPEVRYQVIDLMLDLLGRMASARPVLVTLDDVHWADPSTLLVLHRATRRLARSPILILAGMRPVPRPPELDLLVRDAAGNDQHILVGPLSGEATTALIREILEAEPDPRMVGQLSRAAGNPFYLLELVSALLEEGAVDVSDGRATTAQPLLPPSLRLTILRRLSFLPPATLEALRMAAVLGSSFSMADLATVTATPIAELAAILREALSAGLVVDGGGRLSFRHDLVREAIHDDLAPAIRAGLHLQAGRSLAAAGASSAQVATHFSLGASQGDREAIDWLLRAARESLALSPGVAAEFFERVVHLLPAASDERDQVLAELVHSLLWAGRMADAEAVAREVLSRPRSSAVSGSVRNGLARVLVWQGRPADSMAEIELALHEPGVDDRERSYLLAELALRRLHCRDLPGATDAAWESISLADKTHHSIAKCDALCALAWIAQAQGSLEPALYFAQQAVALSASDEGREARVMAPSIYEASVLVHADRFDEAEASASRGVREHAALGVVRTLPLLHAWRALRNYLAGDLESATSEADLSLAYADEVGLRAFALWGHAIAALIAIHRGQLSAAADAIARGDAEFAPNNPSRFGLPWFVWSRALLEEAEGRTEQALVLLGDVWDYLVTHGCLGETQELAPDLIRLALALGDRERALATAEAASQLCERAATHSARSAALLCQGMLEGSPEVLLSAVEASRSGPRRIELARACEEAGMNLGGVGRMDEAAGLLSEALALYEEMGAQRDVRRLEAGLRSLGIRRGVRGKRQRPSAGWDSLTRAELEVVRLAADGFTNPEIGEHLFVTRRTVASHLSHVFAKLGISSRRELATEVRRRAEPAKSSRLTDVPGRGDRERSVGDHQDRARLTQSAAGPGRRRG